MEPLGGEGRAGSLLTPPRTKVSHKIHVVVVGIYLHNVYKVRE